MPVNKQLVLDVANKISDHVGNPMTSYELKPLVKYIESIDNRSLNGKSKQEIINSLASKYMRMRQYKSKTIDVKELLKNEMNSPSYNLTPVGTGHSSNILSCSTEKGGQNVIISNKCKKYVYLCLDSRNRNLSTDDSVFKWTVINSTNHTQGSVNILSDDVNNITSIQFDKFSIPYINSADNIYKKISLVIDEFSSSSVLMNTGRYHMMFDSEENNGVIQLQPTCNDEGIYRFSRPITVLNTITITFKSPFDPIKFLPDRYNVMPTSVGNITHLTFSTEHNINDSDLVHLSGFKSSSPDSDYVIVQSMNSSHTVTLIDTTTLSIDIDTSSVSFINGQSIECFIAKRRLIIPIRIEYLP